MILENKDMVSNTQKTITTKNFVKLMLSTA